LIDGSIRRSTRNHKPKRFAQTTFAKARAVKNNRGGCLGCCNGRYTALTFGLYVCTSIKMTTGLIASAVRKSPIHDHRQYRHRRRKGRGYAGNLTPHLFMWGILICISPIPLEKS